jgi:hypothetical protein
MCQEQIKPWWQQEVRQNGRKVLEEIPFPKLLFQLPATSQVCKTGAPDSEFSLLRLALTPSFVFPVLFEGACPMWIRAARAKEETT